MNQVYDNPHKKQEARIKLQKLFQGSWTFHEYLTKFQEITKPLNLAESERKEELCNRLESTYFNAVLLDVNNSSYIQLVAKLRQVDDRIQSAKTTEKLRKSAAYREPKDTQGGAVELEAISVSKGNRAPITAKGRAPLRTPEEKTLLLQNKLCFKCCKPGHGINQCTDKYYAWVPSSLKIPFPTNQSALAPAVSNIRRRGSNDVEPKDTSTSLN